jgi:hypothetical protein
MPEIITFLPDSVLSLPSVKAGEAPVAVQVGGIENSGHLLARVAAGDACFFVDGFGPGVKRLILQSAGASVLQLNKNTTTTTGLVAMSNGIPRWSMDLGDAAPESTGNAGSNFYIRRYNDAGAQLGLSISINRAVGDATFEKSIYANVNVVAGFGGTSGSYYFGNSGTKYLTWDGAQFMLNGGQLTLTGDLWVGAQWDSGHSSRFADRPFLWCEGSITGGPCDVGDTRFG